MATLILGTGAGTGATASFDGTDTEGLITIYTAGTPDLGPILTFQYNEPFEYPGVILLTPGNELADKEIDCVYVKQNESTKEQFVLYPASPALGPDVRLQFYYSFVPGSRLKLFTIGEPNILTSVDSGNADLVLAQKATLEQAATIIRFSFYVGTAAGLLRLGVYDATGPGGGPGALLAQTVEITPVAGWNNYNAVTPAALTSGTYWLAYFPSSNSLAFRNTGTGVGDFCFMAQAYGTLPTTFSTTPTTGSDHWSLYGTMQLS
jgi:hypothetical protein